MRLVIVLLKNRVPGRSQQYIGSEKEMTELRRMVKYNLRRMEEHTAGEGVKQENVVALPKDTFHNVETN